MPGSEKAGTTIPARRAILIAGPTASGKSAYAVRAAKRANGVIVNADSMQIYRMLDRLTARPQPQEMEGITHYLYGYVDPARRYSAGAWLADVRALLASPEMADQPVVIVGGTGLYFKALLGGLSEMPAIPAELRKQWRERLAEQGPASLHALLRSRDPGAAANIKPQDGQRIVRALEILDFSGRSILELRSQRSAPVIESEHAEKYVLWPDRAELSERITQRLEHMVSCGVLEEVEKLLACGLDPDLPAMKAIGVREFGRVIEGQSTIENAVHAAAIATRQYAKRQMTWFRNQFQSDWTRVNV